MKQVDFEATTTDIWDEQHNLSLYQLSKSLLVRLSWKGIMSQGGEGVIRISSDGDDRKMFGG